MRPHSPAPPVPDIAFDDVVIRFTRQIYYEDEHTFQLEVRQSPAPLPGGAFQANVEAQLEQFRRIFAQRIALNQLFSSYAKPMAKFGPAQDLADLGHQFYTLLPAAFQQAFPRLIQNVFDRGRGIRLVLEARAGDRADRLLSLPWEILFFQDTRVFLARSPRVLVVRCLLDAVRRRPIHIGPPFNIAHVIAHTPNAPDEYQISTALQQTERDKIREAATSGHYRLVEQPGSVEQMLAALREQPYHIVHFLGHGELYETDIVGRVEKMKRGYLRFVNANGESQWVTGEQLQHLLGFAPTVQLVVLNACHGGANVTGNIVLDLVYNGLPNVVAMQSDILQDAAQYFIEAFYAEIQRGQPIDCAVAMGRAAIAASLPQTLDWCLPVLYTNVGLPEQPSLVKIADRLWHWVSSPAARPWLGAANMALGAVHLVVSLLLLLSGKTFALPDARFVNWTTAGLAVIPWLSVLSAYASKQLAIPSEWPFAAKFALIAHSFGAASVGLALPALYTWFLFMLLVSLGFWGVLSWVAQGMLLGLLFAPGVLFSGLHSYSQVIGHGRALSSDARIERPTFDRRELVVIMAGYMMLLLPWAAVNAWSDFLALPRGGLVLGVLLLILGYALRRT